MGHYALTIAREVWSSPDVIAERHLDQLPQHVAPILQVVDPEPDSIPTFAFVVVEGLEATLFEPGLYVGRLLEPDGQHQRVLPRPANDEIVRLPVLGQAHVELVGTSTSKAGSSPCTISKIPSSVARVAFVPRPSQ